MICDLEELCCVRACLLVPPQSSRPACHQANARMCRATHGTEAPQLHCKLCTRPESALDVLGMTLAKSLRR